MKKNGYVPVNKNAIPEAVQLLDFLYSIQGKYTLTGMHNFASDINRYDQVVDSLTGKTPVVWGGALTLVSMHWETINASFAIAGR